MLRILLGTGVATGAADLICGLLQLESDERLTAGHDLQAILAFKCGCDSIH